MNIKLILKYYWNFLKDKISSQFFILFFYTLGSIGSSLLLPLVYKNIIDIVSTNKVDAYEKLIFAFFSLIIISFLFNFFYRIADYLNIVLQSKVLKELQDFSLEKLERHSYSFFSNAFVGGLVAKTKRFVYAFETLHDILIHQIWDSLIILIGSFIILFYYSQILGIVFLVWMILYSFLVLVLVKWQIPKSLLNAEADTKTTSSYADIINNILTVKTFGTSKRELNNFKEITDDQEKKRRSAWMQQGFWSNLFQSVFMSVFEIIIIWISINLWLKGSISAGTIVLTQLYVIGSFHVVWNISRSIIRASSALTDADEMVKIFEKEIGVKDIKNPEKIIIDKGKIEFKKVLFSYEDSNDVFDNLNLLIKTGEKVALVGHSGAGKTTIIKLLLRFLDIQKGEILIDSQDISNVLQEDLRKNISYVPQEPLLFHRTLFENIAYAKEDASLEEVIEASKKAKANEFIEKLPLKYNSLVGERGIKLSGGERQRIAIARAILKNSPIVVLDEATSSLDSLVEEKIQNALEELIKNKTTIAIAHRLSTIKKMDRIIVFDEGKIVEEGNHNKLLKNKGLYFKLWQSQVGGFIVE